MNTKELLNKTYECKTLEELYTLINGHAHCAEYNYGPRDSATLYEIHGNLPEQRGTVDNTEYYPDVTHPRFGTWYGHDEVTGRWMSNDKLIHLPYDFQRPFIYFGEDGSIYTTTVSIIKTPEATPVIHSAYGRVTEYYNRNEAVLSIKKWKEIKRTNDTNYVCLQPRKEILNWIKEHRNQYFYNWLTSYISNFNGSEEQRIDLPFVATHPEIEQLAKMTIMGKQGIGILKHILDKYHSSRSDREAYNRLFKEGTKASEIFVLPMDFVRTLWEKPSIQTWESVRKMHKLRNCSIDDIVRCEERNLRGDQYRRIDEILRAKDNEGKPLFSFTSLINYLGKIDVNEAIELDEGLSLIIDTIGLGRIANQVPDFDTDSLKRTHDILMRNVRYIKNEKVVAGVKEAWNGKYDFQDGKFLVRQIKDYEDLIDEGTQQSNCLRYCYADSIAQKRCLIYVMRKVSEPDKSLVSIELDPTGNYVRQQLIKFNQPIQDAAQTAFLAKWQQYREQVNEQ